MWKIACEQDTKGKVRPSGNILERCKGEYVYIYVYIYIYTYIHTYIHTYIQNLCMYVCIHLSIYLSISMLIINTHMNNVYMYIYIEIYIRAYDNRPNAEMGPQQLHGLPMENWAPRRFGAPRCETRPTLSIYHSQYLSNI